jgi:tetratricopeptide (TPR) repeat protein
MFTGRKQQLDALTSNLNAPSPNGATVVISAIGGTGGIGKTSLALHWAHQNLDRFPDGQLHVDLHGFAPSGEPMSADTAVRGFLNALGVESSAIPASLDAQAALYRSLVADKHMLVVLDNARSSEQVEPLLPGSPTCTVLVTSRNQLSGLVTRQGAHQLHLGVLSETEARELFTRHVGADRVAAEPAAVTELLGWCGGLPIALSIVAARVARHPTFLLAVLAEELREESARLDALEGHELTANLRAVFSWSYHTLAPDHAEVFGLLGQAPGPDISLPAAANLGALSLSRSRRVLSGLEDASLIQQHAPGRYRMHDLTRLYAAEQSNNARDTALRRLIDYYLHTTHAASQLLDPHRLLVEPDPPVRDCHPHPLRDETEALAWVSADHACLLDAQRLAADQGWHTVVWQFAWTLDSFHNRRGHLHDRLTAWQAALTAAHQVGDQDALILVHRRLGRACILVGRHSEALEHLQQALILAEQTGDLPSQANSHYALAHAWGLLPDDQRALEHATHALRLFENLDNPVEEAHALNRVAWYSTRLGHHEQAHAQCESALTLCRRHHDRDGEATILHTLGYLAHHTGQYTQALDYYQQALDLLRDLGHTYHEADVLDRVGHTLATVGRPDQARSTWQQVLELFQAQHRTTDADRVQRQLDDLDQRTHS